jgi:hypothetical protein
LGGSRDLGRFLVGALQYSDGPTAAADWLSLPAPSVVEAADRHHVAPAVCRYAQATGAPAELLETLQTRYDEQLLRHLTAVGDLEWLAGILEHLGVPWLVMKGPVLADVLWPRPDMREYYDLDVLVARRHFGAVIEGLVDGGAQLVDRNWPLIYRQLRGELTLLLPFGTPLDLHWDLMNDRSLRRVMPLRSDDLLSRARPVPIGNLTLPTFDPVDTLLTVAVHAAHAGATRLVWLKDVERAAAASAVDWEEVDRRARQSGLNLALTVVLGRACRALGTHAPTPGWRPEPGVVPLLARLTDRLLPVDRSTATGHTGQLLYRSIRRSGRDTARAVFDALAHPPKPSSDPPGNPLHLDLPDVTARAGYLEAVEHAPGP